MGSAELRLQILWRSGYRRNCSGVNSSRKSQVRLVLEKRVFFKNIYFCIIRWNLLFILYFLDEAVKETLRQAFISVDKEYFESIGEY